jgi:hypothetical protein
VGGRGWGGEGVTEHTCCYVTKTVACVGEERQKDLNEDERGVGGQSRCIPVEQS